MLHGFIILPASGVLSLHAILLIDDTRSRPRFNLYSTSALILFPSLLPTLPRLLLLPPLDFAAQLLNQVFFSSVTWIQCSLNLNITKLSIPASIQPLIIFPTWHSALILSFQRVSPYPRFPTSNLTHIPLSQHRILSLFHHTRVSLSPLYISMSSWHYSSILANIPFNH